MKGTVNFNGALVLHLQYHRWATELVLEETTPLPSEQLLQNLKGSFPSIYETVVHLYQSDRVWLDRLKERPSGTLADYEAPGCMYELKDAWLPIHDEMTSVVQNLPEDRLSEVIAYKNIAGQPFSAPLWQMVLHVVNHGTYHRGQITNMLRQIGMKPTNLDLIRYYRTELGQV
jgi:uncharacterized damage-inducible protein DinB